MLQIQEKQSRDDENLKLPAEASLLDSALKIQITHNQVGQKKQDVADALCGSRTFYIFFNAVCLSVMGLYENDMYDAISTGQIVYPLCYGTFLSLSAYLFWTTGENPGYAPFVQDHELKSMEKYSQKELLANNVPNVTLSSSVERYASNNQLASKEQCGGSRIAGINTTSKCENSTQQKASKNYLMAQMSQKSEQEEKEDEEELEDRYKSNRRNYAHHIISSRKVIKGDESFLENPRIDEPAEYAHLDQMETPSSCEFECIKNIQSSTFNDSYETTNKADQEDQEYVAKLYYCSQCRRHQPFRSKHCNDCGRCVLKFDHHCFWVGGCVGELNHNKFWFFLFSQTLTIIITFKVFFDGLDRFIIKDEKGVESYSQEYGAFAVLCFVLFIFLLFTGILCFYHAFLILSNQTTWEHHKRSEISYIKRMPLGFNPFSQGAIKNIFMIFCHGGKPREWSVPTLHEAKLLHKNQFNICENEYYSCC